MKFIFILLFFVASTAQAQYKCSINGKTVYADAPCAPDAKAVGALEDHVSRDAQRDRERVLRREQRQLGGIQAEQEADRRQHARQVEAVVAADQANASIKSSRCASARRELQTAQRATAVYRDVGWQNSMNQRAAERDQAARRVSDECN